MAENNRNRGGYGSSDQDWNEEQNRYGRESNYDDRGMGGSYGNRYESGGYGNYGYKSGRYGQDYGEGGYGHYNSESDYDRERYGRQSGRYNRDFDREYRGRTYGGFGDVSSGFGSTRYDRDYTNYTPGGYQNYGGGSGYGGSYLSGGYGSSSYGKPVGSRGYETDYGMYSDRYKTENYGMSDRNRSAYDQGYGGSYGSSYGYGTSYADRNRERDRDRDRSWWDKTTDEVSSWFGDEDAERRRRMDRLNSHRGKGPRNYQRSDERIKEDVNDRLSDDWLIDATDIEVSVQNGEVTLTGTVDDRTSKRRAEDVAEAVSGVRNVENRIRVTSYSTMGATATGVTGTTTGTTTERRARQSNLATDTSKT